MRRFALRASLRDGRPGTGCPHCRACAGFDAKSGQFSDQDTPAIRHVYGQLSQAVLTQQFTLGKGATALAERSAANYIIFVWFRGFTRSGGDKAGEFGKAFAIEMLTAGLLVPERKPSRR